MSTHLPCLRSALIATCAATVLSMTAAGHAHGVNRDGGDVRVIAEGVSLVDQRQYTGQTRVRTSPRADCFGEGTGGSGEKVKLDGSNALGIIKHAQLTNRSLRPLQVTDAFDFGVGVCGIGGFEPPATGYWYIKRNHVGSQTGGDATPVEHGDDILWFLIEDFNELPAELEIKAPARVGSGESFTVKATEYADDGTATPAAGVRIRGSGGAVTGADGEAEVTADGPITRLRGVRNGAIPSNLLKVCSRDDCPAGQLTKHVGTNRRDVVRTTRGQNKIKTLAGRDRIVVRRNVSSPPIIRCGLGRDKIVAPKGQRLIKRGGCEKVKRV